MDTATFKTDLNTLLDNLFTDSPNLTPAQARANFTDGLTDALVKLLKSAEGHYQAGSLIAGGNAVTAVGTSITIKLS